MISSSDSPDDFAPTAFQPDRRFTTSWWTDQQAYGPVRWCSVQDAGGEEVARARVKPGSTPEDDYLGCNIPAHGATHIDVFEVREDLRHAGFGRAAVDCLLDVFGAPAFAVSLNQESDRFWRTLGWREHRKDGGNKQRLLFWLEPSPERKSAP